MTRATRRGIILLECIIALAIFVAIGLSLLAMSNLATDVATRTQRQARARDLARSAMSQIEAKLASPETLSGEQKDDAGNPTGYTLVVHSEPSQFAGLALVEVTASRSGVQNDPDSFTLRSLANLSVGSGLPEGGTP
ncbi:MAG: hypothetical protein WC718_05360 [Phycisphaerales bacterium]|jgi:type II secretory pathway component PulJ